MASSRNIAAKNGREKKRLKLIAVLILNKQTNYFAKEAHRVLRSIEGGSRRSEGSVQWIPFSRLSSTDYKAVVSLRTVSWSVGDNGARLC